MPRTQRLWYQDDEDRATELRADGFSYKAIAALMGRTWQSVRYKLRELCEYHPGGYRRRDRAGRWVGEGR